MATCKADKAQSCPQGAQSLGEMDPEQERWTMGLLSPEEGEVISLGGRGSELIFPLHLYLEDMGCEQHGSGTYLSGS